MLGTPARHEEYSRLRNEVLGEGKLPKAAAPAREPPPLAVMEKQQLRARVAGPPRSERKFDLRLQRFIEPSWQNTLLVLVVLTVATSILAISANVAILLTLLVVCMLFSAVPIIRMLCKAKVATNLMNELEPTAYLRHFDSKRPR